MAGLVCSAIVGVLCLQVPIAGGGLNLKLEDQGIYVANAIEAKDWKLSQSQSMEWAPPKLDAAKLQRACDQNSCVRYWRKCNDARHPAKCLYAISFDNAGSTFFDIAVTGADGFRHAMEAIRIVVDIKAGITVPLAKLDHDGPGDEAPVLPSANTPRPL
jgi:hypothetical protein